MQVCEWQGRGWRTVKRRQRLLCLTEQDGLSATATSAPSQITTDTQTC